MTPWTAERVTELRHQWDQQGGRLTRIARSMGMTRGQIDGKSRVLGLQRHGQNRQCELSDSHPAITDGRTLYPRSRAFPIAGGVLHRGIDMRKLGGRVEKGAWKGFPIYALTLEERATCPRDCVLFNGCYGNGTHWAKRYIHGPDLEIALSEELGSLSRRHRGGFVVRLHILGDFYSAHYVRFWRDALTAFPALHVFGYTAWKPETDTGRAVAALRDEQWQRFAVRTSGANCGPRTCVIETADDKPDGAIICPAQLPNSVGRNCAKCGLCWAGPARDKPIAFLRH